MDDVRRRFESLDQVRVPDLWDRIERRAAALGSVERVAAVHPRVSWRSRDAGRRSFRLVALATALLLVLVTTIAVGSGLIKLPAIVPVDPSASPAVEPSTPVAPSPTASPTGVAWISGRELMDALTADYGYGWSESNLGEGRSIFDGRIGTSDSAVIRVSPPLDSPASVLVAISIDVAAEDGFLHAGRLAEALAPDVSTWLQDAIAQALDPADRAPSAVLTASGGQIMVRFIDEPLLQDWMEVSFSPDPLPIRGARATDSAAVAYADSGRPWVVDADGTDAGILLGGMTSAYGVRTLLGWSADGSRLFYGDDGGGLLAIEADGSVGIRLGNRASLCPVAADSCGADLDGAAVSPVGTRIAYPISEGSDGEVSTIAILDTQTGVVTRLESTRSQNPGSGSCDGAAGKGGNEFPNWSPDGLRLVFGRQGNCPAAIFSVNVDGSDLRRLVPTDLRPVRPRWSPDGSTIAFISTERNDIYGVHPDGTGLTPVTDDGVSVWPFWTRDGRIVFLRMANGDGELWVMDADGANATPLDASVSAQSAAACTICPYPDAQDRYFSGTGLNLRFWQPVTPGTQ